MSKGASPEWYTPSELIEAGRAALGGSIDLDPASCAAAQEVVQAGDYFTREDDGIEMPWPSGARVWLNPPYGREVISPFVQRAIDHDGPAVVLTNNQLDARWAHALLASVSVWCILERRVRFRSPGSTKRPSPLQGQAVWGLRVDVALFVEAFGPYGPCL